MELFSGHSNTRAFCLTPEHAPTIGPADFSLIIRINQSRSFKDFDTHIPSCQITAEKHFFEHKNRIHNGNFKTVAENDGKICTQMPGLRNTNP
jgi:hypothetical protein